MQRGAAKHSPTRDEYEERLAVCERTMLRLSNDYRVASEMMARFGVGRRTATEWCKVVRERWLKAAAPVTSIDHNASKAEARARILEVYRLSVEGVWRDPDQPAELRVPDVDLISSPNLKVANDAAMRLAQLDGHLTAKGVPQPPPETSEDPAVVEIRRGFELVAANAKAAGGVDAFINEQPAKPNEDDMNPRAAVRRLKSRLAELEEELAKLRGQVASG